MNLSTHMKIIYDIKHRYIIRLKIGNKFLTFPILTKLVLQVKTSICSTNKENLHL